MRIIYSRLDFGRQTAALSSPSVLSFLRTVIAADRPPAAPSARLPARPPATPSVRPSARPPARGRDLRDGFDGDNNYIRINPRNTINGAIRHNYLVDFGANEDRD